MRLNAFDTVRSSPGPSSASGSCGAPPPMRRAARVSAASGRDRLVAMSQAPASEIASSARPQPSHCRPNAGSKRSQGIITQNSSESMKKLTQKPSSPSRSEAKRVSPPSASRTRSSTRSRSGSSGSGASFSLAVAG